MRQISFIHEHTFVDPYTALSSDDVPSLLHSTRSQLLIKLNDRPYQNVVLYLRFSAESSSEQRRCINRELTGNQRRGGFVAKLDNIDLSSA